MLADDSHHRGEPEAAPGERRREEVVEDLGFGLGVHARTVVADRKPDIAARGKRNLGRQAVQRGSVVMRDCGGQADLALGIADGLRGVGDQVQGHLEKLILVRL